MTRLYVAAFGLVLLSTIGHGQDQKAANTPFTLTWSQGRCIRCKTATGLGRVQFVSRKDVWAVGSKGELNGVNTIVVRSTDAGRTWREVPQTYQHTDPDGQLAFSFLDSMRGWAARWDPAEEPQVISTRDGGQQWQRVSQQFLRSMQFVDDSRGYGTAAGDFFRTNDGGRSWVQTKISDVRFIDRMLFLTPEIGWIAGIHGRDFLVFRTVNGGKDWQESRTTPPQPPQLVRDLFFLDQERGWLTTWNDIGEGTYLYSTVDGGKNWTPDPDLLFQGKDKQANVVRFTSRERGFVFVDDRDAGQRGLMYTTDGGTHWHRQALREFVYDCQVFAGDLWCSSRHGFRLLTLLPK